MASPKGRILCTEDDADTRELVKFVLSTEGYEVITTDSAHCALRLAQTESFDLFLLDSWLPELGGEDLIRKIRESGSNTPILIYSGAAQNSDKESAIAAGAQEYLVKPSSVDH